MASLGSLVISLAADTAKFQGDLGRAAAIAESRMRNIKDTATRALGALTVVATAAGAALVASFKSATDRADEFGKLAAGVGVTVEQFSRLQYAADLSGLSTEQLQKALAKLAGDGVANANDALIDIAEQFANLPDGADKTARAIDIFGEKLGPGLIPLLNQGRDGLAALAAESDAFGRTISGETAAAAEQFNDNLTRLSSRATGLSNSLAAELLPTLNDFTGYVLQASKDSAVFAESVGALATAFKGLLTVVDAVISTLVTVGKLIGASFAANVQILKGNLSEGVAIYRSFGEDTSQIFSGFIERQSSLWARGAENAARGAAEAGAAAAAELTKKLTEFDEQTQTKRQKALADYAEFQSKIEELRKSGRFDDSDLSARLREAEERLFPERLQRKKQEFEDYIRSLQRAEENRLARQQQISSIGETITERNKEQIAALADATRQSAEDTLDSSKRTFEEMDAYSRRAAENMQDAFANFLFDPFQNGLKGMLKGFIDVIRRMIAEQAAAKIFGSKESGGFGLGDLVSGFVGGFFGGGKAAGGPVNAGTAYMVGERGPELFMPRQSGSIIPNGALAGGGVTVAPVYNIDARGATQDLIQALPAILEANTRRTVELARAAVRDDVSRRAMR